MEPTRKIVDADTWMEMFRDIVREGHSAALTVTGNSMAPFLIHGRDQIRFQKPEKALKRGDMAFFQRAGGACVMHRVCKVDSAGNYYLVGDGQQAVEGPIPAERVFAVVTQVCRKGIWLGPESFLWKFFAGPWLWLRPLRPQLVRIYGWISRVWKRGGSAHGESGSRS